MFRMYLMVSQPMGEGKLRCVAHSGALFVYAIFPFLPLAKSLSPSNAAKLLYLFAANAA